MSGLSDEEIAELKEHFELFDIQSQGERDVIVTVKLLVVVHV